MQPVAPLRGAKVLTWVFERDEAAGPRIPIATIARLGKGQIAGVYMAMGERYVKAKTAVARDFLNSLVCSLFPEPIVEVEGTHCVDVTAARLHGKLMINLVNSSGPHGDENIYT